MSIQLTRLTENPAAQTEALPATGTKLLLPLLIALSALGEVSTQLMLPILPEAAKALHSSPAGMQASLSLFVATLGLGQLLMGPLSDRWGRKPVLLAGVSLYLLATLAAFGAETLPQLVILRMLQGLGASSGVVLARAIARDIWRQDVGPVLALLVSGMMIALMAAPLVGGLVSNALGWRAVFLFTALIGLLALVGVGLAYRESNPTLDSDAIRPGRLLRGYAELLSHRGYLAYLLALGSGYGALFTFVSGSAFVLIGDFGLSRPQYGMAVGLVLSGLLAGTLLARKLMPKFGPARLVRFGTALVLTGVLLSFLSLVTPVYALAALLLPEILVTLGGGLILPSAVAGAVMPFGNRAGLAAGLLGFAQMGIAVAFGFALSLIQFGGATPMLLVQATAALASFGLFRLLMPSEKR